MGLGIKWIKYIYLYGYFKCTYLSSIFLKVHLKKSKPNLIFKFIVLYWLVLVFASWKRRNLLDHKGFVFAIGLSMPQTISNERSKQST